MKFDISPFALPITPGEADTERSRRLRSRSQERFLKPCAVTPTWYAFVTAWGRPITRAALHLDVLQRLVRLLPGRDGSHGGTSDAGSGILQRSIFQDLR